MNRIHLSHFSKSKLLKEMGVDPILLTGEHFYIPNGELCILLSSNEKKYFNLETNKEGLIDGKIYKAYVASELIDFLPVDFSLPQRFEEGWALMSGDDEILLTSAGYYESQVDAVISYLLFYLKHGVLEPKQ